MLELKDPSLFKQQVFLAGEWTDDDDGNTVAVTNPANGDTLGSVPMWPGQRWAQALDGFSAGQRDIVFAAGAAASSTQPPEV